MNPTDITVSLEPAKKLKQAGWGKKTVFVWTVSRKTGNTKVVASPGFYESDNFPAPTLGELFESLSKDWFPIKIKAMEENGETILEAFANAWINHPEIRKA